MKTAALIVLLGSVFSAAAYASEEEEWAKALEIPCHPLITELECRVHRDRLVKLPEGGERNQYLAQHVALVEERVQSCGCTLAQTVVGARNYR